MDKAVLSVSFFLARMRGLMPRRPDVPCSGCGKLMWRGTGSADVPTCRDCRRIARCGTVSGYHKGCRCDACRAAKRAEMAAYAERRAAAGRPLHRSKKSEPRTCESCGCAFPARVDHIRAGGGRFCSARCANVARNLARGFAARPPRKSEFRRRAERLAQKAAEGSSGGGRVYVQGACAVCGSEFLSAGEASRYCSRECRDLNRRNRSFGLSWLDRMALFARDSWTCQICSEPVDYAADYLSDWYPTIDHIVPRSKGGGDEVDNLRTAHRWCNSVRGDLSFYTDADLQAV